jgi:hypothetical protein
MNKKIFLLLGLMTCLSHNVMFAGDERDNSQDINRSQWESLESKLFGGKLYYVCRAGSMFAGYYIGDCICDTGDFVYDNEEFLGETIELKIFNCLCYYELKTNNLSLMLDLISKIKFFVGSVLRMAAFYGGKVACDKILDCLSLYLFLKDWEEKHRDDTPEELHEFFEEEHREFSESKVGIKYIIANTGRVMRAVRGALECYHNEIL